MNTDLNFFFFGKSIQTFRYFEYEFGLGNKYRDFWNP